MSMFIYPPRQNNVIVNDGILENNISERRPTPVTVTITLLAIAIANDAGLDTDDENVRKNINRAVKSIYTKVKTYLGYEPPEILNDIIAEMSIVNYDRYSDLTGQHSDLTRLTRGDYTVQYEKQRTPTSSDGRVDLFGDYEWILRKYKKLRML